MLISDIDYKYVFCYAGNPAFNLWPGKSKSINDSQCLHCSLRQSTSIDIYATCPDAKSEPIN